MNNHKPKQPKLPRLLIACATRNGKTRAMPCIKALAKARDAYKGDVLLWVFDAKSTEYKPADIQAWGADNVITVKQKDWRRVAKERLLRFVKQLGDDGPDLLYLTDARVHHGARSIVNAVQAYQTTALPVVEYCDPAQAEPGERSGIKGRVQRQRAHGYSLLINRGHAERILEEMADHPRFAGEWYELASMALGLFSVAEKSKVKVLK
ncbi:MAG TPA: hypothetical protein VMY37_38400 [Thermoguttaceae bacterium]|nr:hypothetical protein [Thermoguttaceae bacterium]